MTVTPRTVATFEVIYMAVLTATQRFRQMVSAPNIMTYIELIEFEVDGLITFGTAHVSLGL